MPIHAPAPGKTAAPQIATPASAQVPRIESGEVAPEVAPDLDGRLRRALRLGHRAEGVAQGLGQAIRRYPYINSDPPEEKESQIYGIYKAPTATYPDPVYVGQTTWARAGNRFQEHVRDDAGAPWQGHDYSGAVNTWPYLPANIERLKDVTRFETTAAEQYWYQAKGGSAALYSTSGGDANQPMKKATFLKYKTIVGNYDPAKIGLTGTWKPTDD